VAPDTLLQWKWSEVAAIEVLSSRKIRNEPRGVFVDAAKNFQYSFRFVALWFPAELTQNVERQWSRLPPWLQERVILVPLEITVPIDDEDENEFEGAYLNDQGFPNWYRQQLSDNPRFANVAPNMRSDVRRMKIDLQPTTANAPNIIKVINDIVNNGNE